MGHSLRVACPSELTFGNQLVKDFLPGSLKFGLSRGGVLDDLLIILVPNALLELLVTVELSQFLPNFGWCRSSAPRGLPVPNVQGLRSLFLSCFFWEAEGGSVFWVPFPKQPASRWVGVLKPYLREFHEEGPPKHPNCRPRVAGRAHWYL